VNPLKIALRFLTPPLICALIGSASAAEIHVAPSGSDRASGTRAQPFASLTHARDAARELLRTRPGEPVTIWLATGDYFTGEGFTLSAADSGSAEAPVIYRNEEGAKVRLVGARSLDPAAFTVVTDPTTLARIAPALRGKIVALDLAQLQVKHRTNLPEVFNDRGGLPDLFFDGRRLPLARFPNGEGMMTMKRVLDNAGGPRDANWHAPSNVAKLPPDSLGGVFTYRDEFADVHARWVSALARGVWLKGYWRVAWQNEAVRVAAIDVNQRTVTLAKPVQGGIGNKYTRPSGNGRESYWLMNLLEECDQPGEWCVDFFDQKLYFYPPASLAGHEILLADVAAPVVRVEGASHVTLRGLIIEAALGHGIEVKGGDHVLIAGCTVRNVDRYGVVLDGGHDHAVQSCDLYDLGAGGVWLGGGDEKSTPRIRAGHRVENNHIHHFAEIERVYAPAVNSGFTGGGGGGHHVAVGMTVSHNLIHDTPHAGVLFGSWDSLFEFNEVFRYCTVSNDMGAFYSYDVVGRFGGHTFRYNFMHDSDDGDGIYFDHDHSNMKLFGNIAFLKSSGGKRGTSFLYKIGSQAKGPQPIDCRNNIAVQSTIGFVFVSALPTDAKVENNVTVNTRTPWLWRIVEAGAERPAPASYASGTNQTYDTDPGFVDLARHDFHLKPGTRILRDLPGFQSIPVEQIGLYRDEYRIELPTDDEIDRFNRGRRDTGLHYDILDRK
jgi:hypothetical protein